MFLFPHTQYLLSSIIKVFSYNIHVCFFNMFNNNIPSLDSVGCHVIDFLFPVDAFSLCKVFVECRQFMYKSLNNSLAVVLKNCNTAFVCKDPLQSFTSLAKSLPPRSVCIRCV